MKRDLEMMRRCFADNAEDIRRQNWTEARTMTLIYLVCQLAYLFIVCLPSGSAQTAAMLAAIGAQVIYSIILYTRPQAPAGYHYLWVFADLIMALAIYIGTFIDRDEVAWMFIIELIMLTQFYTLPTPPLVARLVFYMAVFVTLTIVNKDPRQARQDVIAAMVALAVALVAHLSLMKYKLLAFQNKAELNRMCSIDAMTCLLNKTTFEHFCTSYLDDATSAGSFAMIILDIDQFKTVNDRHGHISGDAVLQTIADVLKDVFPEDGRHILGRFGGDEFTVMVTDIDRRGLDDNLKQLRADLARRSASSFGFPVTVSIGAVLTKAHDMSFSELFIIADKQLYQAKDAGGDAVRVVESDKPLPAVPVIMAIGCDAAQIAVIKAAVQDRYEVLSSENIFYVDASFGRYRRIVSLLIVDLDKPEDQRRRMIDGLRRLSRVSREPIIVISSDPAAAAACGGLLATPPLDREKMDALLARCGR